MKLFHACSTEDNPPPSPSFALQSTQPYPRSLKPSIIGSLRPLAVELPPGNLTILGTYPSVYSLICASCLSIASRKESVLLYNPLNIA